MKCLFVLPQRWKVAMGGGVGGVQAIISKRPRYSPHSGPPSAGRPAWAAAELALSDDEPHEWLQEHSPTESRSEGVHPHT